MAGITPTYGLRYAELADPPDGAALGKNLADDVEAELARVDAAHDQLAADFTAHAAEVRFLERVTATGVPRNDLGVVRVLASATKAYPAGRVRRLTARYNLKAAANGTGVAAKLFRVQAGVSTAVGGTLFHVAFAGIADGRTVIAWDVAAPAGTYSYELELAAHGLNGQTLDDAELVIEDAGPA